MDNKTKAAIGAGVLAVGVGAGLLMMRGEEDQQTMGNKVVVTKGGKYVRVVTKNPYPDKTELETELGLAVVLQPEEIPGDAQCFVVIDAPIKKPEEGPEGTKSEMLLPYLPDLEKYYYPGTWPAIIGGSEENNSYLWAIMFQGGGCLAAADFQGYAGSDMHQFLNSSAKHRMLKVKRKTPCPPNNDKCSNMVAVNDPDADPEGDIAPPIAILGRDDLNWVTAEKGKVKDRKQVLATREK